MPHTWDANEHRWGERVRVHLPVEVSGDDADGLPACIENLSLSGALLRAEWAATIHSPIAVTIPPALPSQGTALVKAKIARRLKQHIAVEWCEFAPNEIRSLLRAPLSVGRGLRK